MTAAAVAVLLVLVCAGYLRGARALRWAQDELEADVFLDELRAVQPQEIIRASVAPVRATPPAKLRSVPACDDR